MKLKIVERKVEDLNPAEYNPRQITRRQVEDLTESMVSFGMLEPIIVNVNPERKDIIVSGHQRLKIWTSLKNKTVPCIEVVLTLELERELNIRMNKNTGSFNYEILANEFDQDDLIDYGFSDDDFGTGIEPPEEPTEPEADKIKPIPLKYDRQTREAMVAAFKRLMPYTATSTISECVQLLVQRELDKIADEVKKLSA